jgi:hypothetical protein
MTKKIQILCASSGFLFVVLLFAGLLTTGFFPPPSPELSATEVAARWNDHPNLIRLGLVIMMFGAVATAPLVAAVSVQLKRIGPHATVLSYTQMLCGGAGIVAVFMPIMIMMAAAYRPDRDPDLIMLINDLAWIPFIINGPPAIFQCVSIGIAVLVDKRGTPIYPRWVGYLNLWIAFTFLPACLLLFFKTGPFAWNGLLSFWLAASTFGGWFLLMSVMTIRAASRQEVEERAAADLEPVA